MGTPSTPLQINRRHALSTAELPFDRTLAADLRWGLLGNQMETNSPLAVESFLGRHDIPLGFRWVPAPESRQTRVCVGSETETQIEGGQNLWSLRGGGLAPYNQQLVYQ